jgi:hypothetical protein
MTGSPQQKDRVLPPDAPGTCGSCGDQMKELVIILLHSLDARSAHTLVHRATHLIPGDVKATFSDVAEEGRQ